MLGVSLRVEDQIVTGPTSTGVHVVAHEEAFTSILGELGRILVQVRVETLPLDTSSERNQMSTKGLTEANLVWSLTAVCWVVSSGASRDLHEVATATKGHHCLFPPFVAESRSQKYGFGALDDGLHSPLRHAISLRPVRSAGVVTPSELSACLGEFTGIVGVDVLYHIVGSKELQERLFGTLCVLMLCRENHDDARVLVQHDKGVLVAVLVGSFILG